MDIKEFSKQIIDTLGSEVISEEVATKFATLFATKISSLQEEFQEELAEQAQDYEQKIEGLMEAANSYGEVVKDQITESVGAYVEMAVADFIKESNEQFQKLEDYERQSAAFKMIKESFEANGFKVEPKLDADNKLAQITENYNTLFDTTSKLKAENEKLKKQVAFSNLTEGLTTTQSEKVQRLADNVIVEDVSQYETVVKMLVEQVTTTGEQVTKEEKEVEIISESNNNVVSKGKKYTLV